MKKTSQTLFSIALIFALAAVGSAVKRSMASPVSKLSAGPSSIGLQGKQSKPNQRKSELARSAPHTTGSTELEFSGTVGSITPGMSEDTAGSINSGTNSSDLSDVKVTSGFDLQGSTSQTEKPF